MKDKKIFIIGTITHQVPEKFRNIEKQLKKDFDLISTYEVDLIKKEKINWVYEQINSSDIIVGIFPQISFGTSFELGYSVAKNKKIVLITSDFILESLKEHPVIFTDNITCVNYEDYSLIKKIIQNLLQSHL